MPAVPSLESVTFDTTELKFQQTEPNLKVWYSKFGDGMGLWFFLKQPDLPNNLTSVDQLRDFYQSALQKTASKLAEISITRAGGCAAVRSIIKSPQKPLGMTYVGSFTVPFREFSYVFKAQCEERGTTGMREASSSKGSFEKAK